MKRLLYIILFAMTFTVSDAKWEYYNDSNSLIKRYASSIVVDYNNTIWFKSDGRIIAIEGDNWTMYDSTVSKYITYATDLTIDIYGNLWFASNGSVVKFENGNFIEFDFIKGIHNIEFDSEGNYWVANKESIFKKEDGKFIEKYRDTTGEFEPTKLIIDGKDNIYFKRFFYFDLCQLKEDITVICYNNQNSGAPSNYSFYSSALDSNGNIWLGGDWSIMSFDGSSWTVIDSLKTNNSHSGRFYRGIGFDKNNTLWALSNWSSYISSDLFKIDENLESYKLDSSILGNEFANLVNDLAIDFNGNVWVTSNMGLFKFTPEVTDVEYEKTYDNKYNISYGVENIEISSSDNISKIEIFDLMGSSLFSLSDIDNYEYTVNTASLMKGLYILRVDNISYKFLKR